VAAEAGRAEINPVARRINLLHPQYAGNACVSAELLLAHVVTEVPATRVASFVVMRAYCAEYAVSQRWSARSFVDVVVNDAANTMLWPGAATSVNCMRALSGKRNWAE